MALGFLVGSRPIADNSFFTHFATGGVIFEDRSVPTGDVFSATAAGEAWTVQSWFASVLYRGVYELAGLGALRVMNGLLIVLLVAAIWRLTAPAKTLLPRVLLTGVSILIGTSMWTSRPLVFGLLGLAFAIVVIDDERKPLWLLVPVMWLWVNTHGSFPLVFVYLGAVVAGHVIDTRSFRRRDVEAGAWLSIGALAAAINPLGFRLLVFPFELLSKREALQEVAEWDSPSFDRPAEWGFLVLLLLLFAAAKLGASWRHLLPAIGFFVTGLIAVRNINPAVVVMIACAAPALASLPGAIDGAAKGIAARGIVAVSGIALVLVSWSVLTTPAIDYERYPVLEVDWLEARGLVAQAGTQLIHRDTTGNYLELRFGRDSHVFVDDRFDMFPQQILDDHLALHFGGDFEEILERYDADAVLWEAEGEFADWLRSADSDWTIGFEGERYVVAIPAEATS